MRFSYTELNRRATFFNFFLLRYAQGKPLFNMNWFVYIAQAKTGYYYTGISPEPEKRIIKHNTGKGSQMAKQQGPFILVYTSKPFLNKSEARKREIQVKGWDRNKKEKLIQGDWI